MHIVNRGIFFGRTANSRSELLYIDVPLNCTCNECTKYHGRNGLAENSSSISQRNELIVAASSVILGVVINHISCVFFTTFSRSLTSTSQLYMRPKFREKLSFLQLRAA